MKPGLGGSTPLAPLQLSPGDAPLPTRGGLTASPSRQPAAPAPLPWLGPTTGSGPGLCGRSASFPRTNVREPTLYIVWIPSSPGTSRSRRPLWSHCPVRGRGLRGGSQLRAQLPAAWVPLPWPPLLRLKRKIHKRDSWGPILTLGAQSELAFLSRATWFQPPALSRGW